MSADLEQTHRDALRLVRRVATFGFIFFLFMLINAINETSILKGQHQSLLGVFLIGMLGSLICFAILYCQLIARALRKNVSPRKRRQRTLLYISIAFAGLQLGPTLFLTFLGALGIFGILCSIGGIITALVVLNAFSLNDDPVRHLRRLNRRRYPGVTV